MSGIVASTTENGAAGGGADAGAHALLVGEALVLSGDIEAKARELMLVGSEARS